MTAALLRPQPLPLERVRPGALLLVVGLHAGLLWVVNVYWPLQSILFSAVQNTAQSIAVQILQKPTQQSASAGSDNPALNANPQAISNPGRQRFGRAEAMLELPAAQLEASTPLAGTVQIAQAAPPRPVAAAAPVLQVLPVPESQPNPAPAPAARPVPQAVAAPERVQAPVVPNFDEKQLQPAQIQPPAAAPPTLPPAPASPVTAAVPLAVPAPAPSAFPTAPAAPAPVAATPVASPNAAASSSVNASALASNPGTATASGAAQASGAGPAVASPGSAATPVLLSPNAGAPLNLNLPPRYIYRPPIAVPRRSLSEMANEQLRRKPRDPFAEGIEGAGNIDCLKDTPEGPAQGLLAIGPLLKRAIEEKCRK